MALNLTFGAGNTAIASKLQQLADYVDLVTGPLWVLTAISASAAIGASGVEQTTAALQAPASTYLAHTAYRIKIRGLLTPGTTSGNLSLKMRDTDAAGTIRMDNVPAVALVASAQTLFQLEHTLANTGGSNIGSRVLCVTMSHTAAGGARFNAAATFPWYIECKELGADADYPNAVAL